MTNGLPMTVVVVMAAAMVVGYVTCDCVNPRAVLTFNAGLTTTVHDYSQRKSAVADAIKTQGAEADFMCLQEMWFEEDMKAVLDKVGADFPYHYSAIHHSVGRLRGDEKGSWWKPAGWDTVPCTKWKVLAFLACMGLNCAKASNQRKCMNENCHRNLYGPFYGLSQNCRSCMSVASSGATSILDKCARTFKKFNRVNRPGLLVLSKKPLSDVQYVNFHHGFPVLLERGYIQAKSEGLTHVCAHLSAVFRYHFEVGLPQYMSFKQQQLAEIRMLNSTFFSSLHLLMGDLNTGPERNVSGLPILSGEAPANYDFLTNNLHYQNPYLQNNGNCTYCPSENRVLIAENMQYGDLVIDHVLTSPGVTSDVTSAKRVFDDKNTALSDHYGVQVDICLP
ncbi:uncharacterized protein LOC143296058 [Babylonia areolata]|uniref:uncharacterized protein LOC143296058 n=1 Tax=Babylonia areolata TaxID=304850 RepID=UPI003FD200DB